MSEYRRVLFKWASQYIEEGAIITDVTFVHDEGYKYSSYTYQDPYDEIRIHYKVPGTKHDSYCLYLNPAYDAVPAFGELLSELFELAEREDNEL